MTSSASMSSHMDKDKDKGRQKEQLIVQINQCTSTREVCQVLGLDMSQTIDEVTRKRKEFSLMIHPDKNPLQKEAANSAFILLQKGCDFYHQILTKTRTPKSKWQQQSTRSNEKKASTGRTKKDFPSRLFTRSESSSKKSKYNPPTEREFADLVQNIDDRVSMWRSFINPLSSNSNNLTSSAQNTSITEPNVLDEVIKVTSTGVPSPGNTRPIKKDNTQGNGLNGEKEEFVCLLCRRQFVSEAHLSRHFRSSKLHASLYATTMA